MAAAAAAVAPLLLPAIVLLLSWCVSPAAAAQPCTANDLAALRGFSAGLDAPVSGWPPPAAAAGAEEDDDCCSWPGVLCGGSPAIAVVELSLPNRTLRGQISGSLSGLPSLRVLNLSGNALRGPLPPEILLNLQSLQILDLSSNAINNLTLPSVVSTSLRVFNVSGNSLTGPHPVLPGAINLTVYEVSGNALTGAISAAALCRESPNLKILRLSMNRLDGLFPTGFSRCGSLAELALDGNGAIHGSLPEDLFKLESLQTLILHGNSLSGAVSPLLRRLTSLVRLDISFNGFSGELPEAFDGMAGTLQELSAAGNLVSGQLPATLSLCSRLRVLNLRNNSLSGAMAARLDGLLSPGRCGLVYLDLGVNKFTGGIPAGLAGCSAMTALNLGRNSLAGEIPSSFAAAGAFPALSFLSLTGNGFSNVTSALTTLQRLPKLTSLVLTKNFHGGEMMPALGIDGFANLEVLVIANCELSGEIPPWLTGMKKLKVLDLSWNRLSGAIPPWLGEFERLFYLDVSNNSLRGEIPGTLASMPGLVAAGAGEDDEEAAAVQDFPFFIRPSSSPAAKGRQYNQVSSFPPSLVLSRNGLAGRIPPAMGALTRVHVVDLSWNKLSGPIPPELAGMTSLESFDASRNELTGPIPASLTGLSFLSHFSVAFNGLSGQIPLGGQFSTFSRADFEGNPLLCGRHVGRRCDRVAAPQQVINGSKDRRSANAGVVAAICVGTVMLLAAGVVATWRMWSKRRQEDNARVAADDDDHDVDPEAARLSKMVLLFPDDDDETDGVVKGTRTAMSVEEVVKATGNFAESRIVGCGGFGMVYRATLSDGCDVAVKRLSGDTWQAEREFQAEVDALSHVSHHRNLVSLRGYCRHVGASGDYRLLIYPYMENGSLDHWLHERGSRDLPWPTRMRIAVGAARGLAHLHDGPSRTRVLHRDVKSSNILLDGAMEARLGDFGLSRLARAHDDTHVTTDLVGTLGYIPPEYGHSAVATCRGDVYSMGVVLVELVTGRRPVDMAAGATRGGRRDVTSWAVRMRREGKGEEVVDIDVARVEMHRDEAMRVLDVACACVREDPKARPTAQQVADRLDAIADATDSSSSSGSSSDT